jgi:hypothetical protein
MGDVDRSVFLDRAAALTDLDQLGEAIAERYSYAPLTAEPFQRALAAARGRIAGPISLDELAREVMLVLASLADGHVTLAGAPDAFFPREYAPFLFAPTAEGVVAFLPDRSGFVDEEHRYVVALDGLPVDHWLEVAGAVTPAPTVQFHQLHRCKMLRHVGYLRGQLGLANPDVLRAEFSDGRGRSTVDVSALAGRKPLHGPWPRRSSGMIGRDLGYLRIERMERSDATRGPFRLAEVMLSLRDSRALVIDVRGNGGGARDLVHELLPYLMRPNEPPAVVNVAAYRLRRGERPDAAEGYLADRGLFPLQSSTWTAEERASIASVAARFAPRWSTPLEGYSAWHYMAVSRPPSIPFFYDRPVAVLLDAGTFSAAEILVAALGQRPNVILFGGPSGGGSGRPRGFPLRNSRLRVHASTMISFRADGRLMQGQGFTPDHPVAITAEDWVGRADGALDRACRFLREAAG